MMNEREIAVLSPAKLRTLYKLLGEYAKELHVEQPLAAQIVQRVRNWVESEERFDQ